MKTLVTGGTGFIGRYLVAALKERGDDIRCLVRHPDPELELAGVEQVTGDLCEPSDLKGIADGVETVFHLVAAGHVGAVSKEAYDHFYRMNVTALVNLLEEVRRADCVRKIIHFSSTAAMGLIVGVAKEDSECNPTTPYQISKHEAEDTVHRYFLEYKLPAIIVRPSMVYGPGDRNKEFLSMCKLVKSGVFPVPEHVDALTPLVFVSDVAKGALLAAEKGNPGETYILTGEAAYPVVDLARSIGRELRVRQSGVFVPRWVMSAAAFLTEKVFGVLGKPPIISRQRVTSVYADRAFDITKAKTELGYQPQVTLEEGVARTIKWFKEQDLI